MRHGATALTAVVSGLLFCANATAASPGLASSGFGEIPLLNPFRLRPPAPVQVDEAPPPPVAKLTLRGITTFQGVRRALLNAIMPAKTGEPAHEESYILAEGQKTGEIEVMLINEVSGTVVVNESGTQVTLTFEKNAPPPQGPQTAPAPGNGPSSPNGLNSRPGLRTVPTRPPRTLNLPGTSPAPPATAES